MNKLIEAAQAVVDRFVGDGYSPTLIKAIWALRDALAEDRLDEMQRITESDYSEGGQA